MCIHIFRMSQRLIEETIQTPGLSTAASFEKSEQDAADRVQGFFRNNLQKKKKERQLWNTIDKAFDFINKHKDENI